MELATVAMEIPDGCNIIIGQTHFIKSVEDLYELIVTGVPHARFGLAFCEASGPCLIRSEGNDDALVGAAVRNAEKIGAGHAFVLLLGDVYPINVLNAIKQCPEVCSIFCATANPVQVLVAETEQGRGAIGVIDGFRPKGVEGPADVAARKEFLRKIGYKR
jgi:adenosine/AMP kinase